jgi:catechol 1,2-dioxygenase
MSDRRRRLILLAALGLCLLLHVPVTAQPAPPPNPRLAEVYSDLLENLETLIKKHRITFEEYRQATGFLVEAGKQGEIPLLMDVLLSVAVDDVNYSADGGTESNVEGPFYVPDAPMLEPPFELPRRADEPGDDLLFSGSVLSVDGKPLSGAVVDIWQADADGKYSRFFAGIPSNNLRGRLKTDAKGHFEVHTVVPASYEIPKAGPTGQLLAALGKPAFRPAHIHVKVFHPECLPLTTQIYFEGDPWLSSDVARAVKPSLIAKLEKQKKSGDYACSHDFVLHRR